MNKVIYDWLTFTTKIHSVPDIVQLLGLSDVPFESAKGRYCYADRLHYDGINIYFNGGEDMGVCVEFSGQGCRNFETLGNGDYDFVFSLINEHYDVSSDKRQMNITRLDIAYDDFEGILDLNYLMFAAQKGEYISRCKDIEVIYSNKGCSVCHGSRLQSNVYIRIYDKKAERNRQDLSHWVRCEMKLKDTCAKGFINLGGDIRKNYFDVLNNYLRYIVPNNNTTNKSMVVVSPQWLRFIESWETVSIFDKPGAEYNIMNLDHFINEQMSGAIITYASAVGVDTFLQNIVDARKGKKLNPKYTQILSDTQSSTDSILDYLELKKEMY